MTPEYGDINWALRQVPAGWLWKKMYRRHAARKIFQVRFTHDASNRHVHGYGDTIMEAIQNAAKNIEHGYTKTMHSSQMRDKLKLILENEGS